MEKIDRMIKKGKIEFNFLAFHPQHGKAEGYNYSLETDSEEAESSLSNHPEEWEFYREDNGPGWMEDLSFVYNGEIWNVEGKIAFPLPHKNEIVEYYIVWRGEGASSKFTPYTKNEFKALGPEELFWIDKSYQRPRTKKCQVNKILLYLTEQGHPEIINGRFFGRSECGEDTQKKYTGVSYSAHGYDRTGNGVIEAGPVKKEGSIRSFLLQMYLRCIADGSLRDCWKPLTLP